MPNIREMMRFGWILIACAIVVAAYFYTRSNLRTLPIGLIGEEAVAVHVAVARKVAGPITIRLKGEIAPARAVDIVAPFAGRVVEVRYKIGEAVRAGAIVAIIHSNALGQRGAEIEATISVVRTDSQAKEEHLRSVESFGAKTRALYEQDLIARRDIEEAQRAVDAARAQLDFVRAQLAQQEAMLTQLRTVMGLGRLSAPFSGVVSRLLANPGATVAESTPIITVADVATLSLTARVTGVNAGAIRTGLPAEVFSVGPPGDTLSGKVARVAELKGDGIPNFEVEIHISPPTNLTPGMTVEAAIRLENQPVGLWLPRSAVVSMKRRPHVYKVSGGKAWLQEVTLGNAQGGEVEIKTGLEDGEIVVSDPSPNLTSGGRIEPSTSLETERAK